MAWKEFLADQQRLNETTRQQRAAFAEHREQVMRLLLGGYRSANDRLCVLAAGNGNDIDLVTLTDRYSEVHLVDADADALRHCVSQGGRASCQNAIAHAPVDLTGIGSLLGGDAIAEELVESTVRETMARSQSFPCPQLGGPFDVVASTCLLSQLVDAIAAVVPHDRDDFLALILEVRRRHLELLFELLAMGGRGILIVDFVSSVTFPELVSIPRERLAEATRSRIHDGDFFTGLNPFAIYRWFAENQSRIANFEPCTLHKPWRWNTGTRQFAVSAITFTRAAAEAK